MPREIKSDLEHLFDFIDNYSLKHLITDVDFNQSIKQQHKRYFAYLTYIAEIQNYLDDSNYPIVFRNNQYSYIKESCSDMGISFFSTFHGSYKSSKLLLRSSIETFFKGFCLDEIPNIDTETSMFRMFDNIKGLDFFSNNPLTLAVFNKIHQSYKLLCQDVHTATVHNMANISALNYFPSFNKSEAESVCKYTINLIPCYLVLLLLNYNAHFHIFHHINKEIIMEPISRKYRPKIYNID